MRVQDQVVLALTMWRENRSGGVAGMQSIANVVTNRVHRRGSDAYAECTRALQFSSITAKGDPQLSLWPSDGDVLWDQALDLAARALAGALEDLTNGATLYYAPGGIRSEKTYTLPDGTIVPFPAPWNPLAVHYLGEIAGHLFFAE